jgi:hypothetical protein
VSLIESSRHRSPTGVKFWFFRIRLEKDVVEHLFGEIDPLLIDQVL